MATPPSNGDDPASRDGFDDPDVESTDGGDSDPTSADGTASSPEPDGDDADGVDYAWVMETTFVLAILVGVPVVAVLAAFRPLPTWEARVGFAVRVGAVVWILTALATYAYARRTDGGSGNREAGDGGSGGEDDGDDGGGSRDAGAD